MQRWILSRHSLEGVQWCLCVCFQADGTRRPGFSRSLSCLDRSKRRKSRMTAPIHGVQAATALSNCKFHSLAQVFPSRLRGRASSREHSLECTSILSLPILCLSVDPLTSSHSCRQFCLFNHSLARFGRRRQDTTAN